MKIIKGAKRAHVELTVRKIVEMVNDGEINFEIDIQRGYVWKNKERCSALIRSLILDRHIPPIYCNKIEDIYEGEDGKQRVYTIIKFLNDEIVLVGLEPFEVINDDGEIEEIDINGFKFSELPECFQNAIKEYTFTVCFTDNASQDEVADTFFNLNNGQALNAAAMSRVKAKSKEQIIELSKHKVFQEALSTSALEGHVNDDLVAKAHAILNDPEVSMNATWIRKYMRNAEITNEDVANLNEVFDRIRNIHAMIEDKKIAKRIYTRTHMISIVPVILESIKSGLSDKQMMEWFVNFFSGKRSATISKDYNNAAGTGSGKNVSVMRRINEVKKNYDGYFVSMKVSS